MTPVRFWIQSSNESHSSGSRRTWQEVSDVLRPGYWRCEAARRGIPAAHCVDCQKDVFARGTMKEQTAPCLRLETATCSCALAEQMVHNCQMALPANHLGAGNANGALKLASGNGHGPGIRRRSGGGLRESGCHGCVKCQVAFDLLHDLVNVAIQHRHRAEALEQRQGRSTVVSAPTPFLVDHPERNMSEDNDWCGRAELREIGLQPCELFGANVAHCIDLNAIVQTDEVNTFVIKAVPAVADGVLSKPLLILFAVIQKIVLARNIEDLVAESFDEFGGGIELSRFGVLGYVAGMEHEVGSCHVRNGKVRPVDRFS